MINSLIHWLETWWFWMFLWFVFFSYLKSGFHVTDQWERKPVKRWGKYVRTLGPGVTWMEPFSSRVIKTVTIRDQVANVCGELGLKSYPTLQTHDNVPISFVTIITYKIVNPTDFVLEIADGRNGLYQRTMTCVSEFIGQTELDEVLHDRQALYATILPPLQEMVKGWGIKVIAIELKDVTITDSQILEAISMKARAQKEAEAELARAHMQAQIAEQLKKAAEVYDADAWKLKGFETLLELCRSAQNNTVMIPTDLVQGLAKVLTK